MVTVFHCDLCTAEREKRLKNREEQKWALENPELASQMGVIIRSEEFDGEKEASENRLEAFRVSSISGPSALLNSRLCTIIRQQTA